MSYSPRGLRWAFLGAVALLAPLPLAAQADGHPSNLPQRASKNLYHAPASTVATWGVRPEEVTWVAVPQMPGVEAAALQSGPEGPYVVRLKFPDGYAVRAHHHGAQLLLTVLEGSYKLGFGTSPDPESTVTYPAGSYAVVPAGVSHFAWTEGETVVQVASVRPIKLDWVAKQ